VIQGVASQLDNDIIGSWPISWHNALPGLRPGHLRMSNPASASTDFWTLGEEHFFAQAMFKFRVMLALNLNSVDVRVFRETCLQLRSCCHGIEDVRQRVFTCVHDRNIVVRWQRKFPYLENYRRHNINRHVLTVTSRIRQLSFASVSAKSQHYAMSIPVEYHLTSSSATRLIINKCKQTKLPQEKDLGIWGRALH
jgi:hypothetical protein